MPTGTKRKSAAAPTSSRSKKARKELDCHSDAKELVNAILEDGETVLDVSDAYALAKYARYLEGELETHKPQEADIQAEASVIRNICVSGIKKQMVWKDSCKTGSAKFSYEGMCTNPLVFAAVLKVDGTPKKIYRFPVEDFEDIMGSITAEVRYDYLSLVGKVSVTFKPEAGTFKISGCYGAPRHMDKKKS